MGAPFTICYLVEGGFELGTTKRNVAATRHLQRTLNRLADAVGAPSTQADVEQPPPTFDTWAGTSNEDFRRIAWPHKASLL